MTPRKRILALLCALFLGALGYYFLTTDRTGDLVLLGTVDANQVLVGAQVLGRIEKLAVEEGQEVKAGDLIALLDPTELGAAKAALDAQSRSVEAQVGAMKATFDSTRGDTTGAVASARAVASGAAASLAEASANRQNQENLTRRTTALAREGILSAQDHDTAVQALKASEAREKAARDQVAAAQAALLAAEARTSQAQAARRNVDVTAGQWAAAQAQAREAGARLGYTRIVAPVSGRIGIWAARQGEVVAAGSSIVSIIDLRQTWVYAAVAETEADAVRLGDHLQVRMPGGARVDGKVLLKAAEADFATQRDVSRRKRDIKTVRIKLLIDNPGERFVPGMTAEVLLPRRLLAGR